MAQTASDGLIALLQEWGVDTIFGLPGDGINGIVEALRRRAESIRFIQVCASPIFRRPPESSTDTWSSSPERETLWLSDDVMTRITGETQNGRWRSAPGERIVSAGLLATAARSGRG